MLNRLTGAAPVVVASLVLIAACAAPARPPRAPAPEPAPPALAGEVWTVTGSDVEFRVYRDGPLAGLGHNHVVTSTALAGRIELREPFTESDFVLELPLASLVVDEPSRRAAAGPDFPEGLSEADREGTRANMLGPKLLDAAANPVLRLTALGVSGAVDGDAYRIEAEAELAGRRVRLSLPATVARSPTRLEARGAFSVTHAELGLEPYAVAMGALRMREAIEVRYRLEARPGRPAT